MTFILALIRSLCYLAGAYIGFRTSWYSYGTLGLLLTLAAVNGATEQDVFVSSFLRVAIPVAFIMHGLALWRTR
jgi:hypothetical protein